MNKKKLEVGDKCPNCGSEKMIETITGGMTMKVLWDGDYITKEDISYEKNTDYSKYECAECKEKL